MESDASDNTASCPPEESSPDSMDGSGEALEGENSDSDASVPSEGELSSDDSVSEGESPQHGDSATSNENLEPPSDMESEDQDSASGGSVSEDENPDMDSPGSTEEGEPTEGVEPEAMDESDIPDSDMEDPVQESSEPKDENGISNAAPDPYFIREDIRYSFLTTGCNADDPYCLEVVNPIQAAIDDIKLNGMPDDSTIYFEAGTYDHPILIDGFNDDGSAIPFTLQGESAGNSILRGDIAIRDSSGPIRLDTFVFEGLITLENIADVVLTGTSGDETIQINLEGDEPIEVTVDGKDGDDEVIVHLQGTSAAKTVNVHDSGLSNADKVEVYGTGLDDSFAATENTIVLGLEIIHTLGVDTRHLNAGDGIDSLLGPDSDTTWDITGPNAGQIMDLGFTEVENLIGAVINQDTFVFKDSGTKLLQLLPWNAIAAPALPTFVTAHLVQPEGVVGRPGQVLGDLGPMSAHLVSP